MFCIERNMVTNKNGLDVLYVTFKDACDKQFNHGLNHGLLDKNKFYYAMLQLARIYYSGEDRPFEAMFMRMLAADQGMGLDFKRKCARNLIVTVIGGRLPRQDGDTILAMSDIYSLDAMQVNISYQDQLRRLFTKWVHWNQQGKASVTWKELQEKGQKGVMIARCFLSMCQYKSLIPNLFNVEALQEFFQITLPPVTQGQIDFYELEKLIAWYNEEGSGADEPMKDSKGDEIEPAMQFHEFLFMLGLVARKSIPISNDCPTFKEQLQELYVRKLELNPVNVDAHVELTYEDVLEKAIEGRELRDDSGDEEDGDWASDEGDEGFDADPNQKKLLAMQMRKMAEEQEIAIDWGMLQAEIERCPKIPQPPVVEQINPPPYPMARVLFGKLMPKPEDEKKGGKKGAAKKADPKKKGEKPKEVKWADGPPPQFKSTAHYIDNARKDLYQNVFPMNTRGEQGNPGVAPVIIKEVYFPPEAP